MLILATCARQIAVVASKFQPQGFRNGKWAWPADLKNGTLANLHTIPTKPTFARAQILEIGKNQPEMALAGGFEKWPLLNLAISAFSNPLLWRVSNRSKGGTLTSFFSPRFSMVVPKPLQIRGYCTSVASEMSCVMQIRLCWAGREFQM